MKTRHIIAIGLLTATATALLFFGIKKGIKPKPIGTKAENREVITDLSGTAWKFENHIYISSNDNREETRAEPTRANINYYVNFKIPNNSGSETAYTQIVQRTTQQDMFYGNWEIAVYGYNQWYNNFAKTIFFDADAGTDKTNQNLINFLSNNATRIVRNLTNTAWNFYNDIEEINTRAEYQYNIDFFTLNNNTKTYYKAIIIRPATSIWYLNLENNWITVYDSENWVQNYYKSIYIEGGGNRESAYLISFLYTNAIYEAGYLYGYTNGYSEGYTYGYNAGYGIGYNDSDAFNHPIDFAPMMLNILTMPFTFISQAFDVTLWPGTQYQINIGNFIKAMIAISAILFIIRLFTSGFSIIGNYSANVQNHKLTKQKIAESKAKTNLMNRTDPNHKTSHKTSVNVNHNYKHKE